MSESWNDDIAWRTVPEEIDVLDQLIGEALESLHGWTRRRAG
jgi:hypothetical protein